MGLFGRKERQAEEKDPYEFVTNQCWEIGKESELTDEEIKAQIQRLRSLGLTVLDDHAIASLEPRQEYDPVQAMKTAHLLRNVIYPPAILADGTITQFKRKGQPPIVGSIADVPENN